MKDNPKHQQSNLRSNAQPDAEANAMHVRKWIRPITHEPTFWLVLVFLFASGFAAYVLAVDLNQRVRSNDLAASARAQSELLSAVRSFYSREVIDKLKDNPNITVSHEFHGKELTVPLPASFAIGLEEELKARGAASTLRLTSDYPFPWRSKRQLDPFETEALRFLTENPEAVFERLEDSDGGQVFRSATAVIMDESCIACHNQHSESPRIDWKVGDVRGIQEVIVQADSTHDTAVNSFYGLVSLLGIAFVTAVALSVLLTRQRQKALLTATDLAASEKDKNQSLQTAISRAEAGEAQIGAIIETVLDGIVTISFDGLVQTANLAAVSMFGAKSRDDLVGQPIDRFIPETTTMDGRLKHIAISDDDDSTSINQRHEMAALRLDGSQFPIELSLSALAVPGLHVVTAILRDLTEKKAADAKLKMAETLLFDAIESLPDGFVLYDADDRLVLCNSKYKEFYATSADLIVEGETFEGIIRKGATRGQYQVTGDALEEWVAMRLTRHLNPGNPMEQHLDDGRWLRVIESRTSEGGRVGFRVDITELKERERDLQRSQDLLRNVVSASFDGVLVMDRKGMVIDYNPAAQDIFGWKREEILGQHMSDFVIPARYRRAHDAGLRHFLDSGEGKVIGQRIEIEGLHKDGHEIIVELAIRNTDGQDGPVFVGYVRDITEQRAADATLREAKERAEIANEAKAQFLAMMSHEIRTPLNGVLGILSLLRDTELDEGQKDYVKTARESGRALLDLINDILDFTKLEAGRMELDATPFHFPSLLGSVIDLFMPIARDKGIDITLDYAGDIPTSLVGDSGRIRQVLLNLVSNALKFTETGGVRIAVKLENGLPEQPVFKLAVSDTGIGIPPEKHDILFGEFVTVDTRYSRKFGGTGLGLAITKQLAELMGGTVGFDSMPGAGSTFWVMLPMTLAGENDVVPAQRIEVPASEVQPGLRVLLAEDNATNQIVVGHMLENAGCRVEVVNDGGEAVAAATKDPYDCILMDISMPEMDGMEATGHIRQAGMNRDTPIIALTAYALKGDRDKFLASGMTDFLAKPVEKEDLLNAIARNVSADQHRDLSEQAEDALHTARAIVKSMPVEIREKLIRQFMSDIGTRCEAARQATAQQDLEGLERATHAIKSVAGTFGAKDLASVAALINSLARDEKRTQAFSATSEMLDEGDRTLSQVARLATDMGIDVKTPS